MLRKASILTCLKVWRGADYVPLEYEVNTLICKTWYLEQICINVFYKSHYELKEVCLGCWDLLVTCSYIGQA